MGAMIAETGPTTYKSKKYDANYKAFLSVAAHKAFSRLAVIIKGQGAKETKICIFLTFTNIRRVFLFDVSGLNIIPDAKTNRPH